MSTTSTSGAGLVPASPTPFSWNIFTNLVGLQGMKGLELIDWLDKFWFRLMIQLMAYAGTALLIGLLLNDWGLQGLNGWLGFGFVFIGLVTLLRVWMVLPVTVVAKITTDDERGEKKFTLKDYLQAVAHVTLFVGNVFLVLSIVKFHNFVAVGVILLGLLSFGLWSLAYQRATGVYAKVSLGIIVVSMVLAGYTAVTWESARATSIDSAERADMERIDKADAQRYAELDAARMNRTLTLSEEQEWTAIEERRENHRLWRKTKDGVVAKLVTVEAGPYKVQRLVPLLIDDIPAAPGRYTLEVVPVGDVVIDGTLYDLTSYVRINGKRSGQEIFISSRGTARLSYTFGKEVNLEHPQNLYLRLKPIL